MDSPSSDSDTAATTLQRGLPREEYIEQMHLYSALARGMKDSQAVQTILGQIRYEILVTTKLPMAIDFLLAELNHSGEMAPAMQKMSHYFAPFQAFLMAQAEDDRGRIDMLTVLKILEHEARFRGESKSPVAFFFFHLEVLCRNRLEYDAGLAAMAGDPIFDETWKQWLLDVRQKIGMVDIADLVYVHSQASKSQSKDLSNDPSEVILFGEKEGRIALANRRKDPTYFFSALQRQLGYPTVPRPQRKPEEENILPRLSQAVNRLEARIKLLEDEQREKGIDLSQFYKEPEAPKPLDDE